MYKIYGVLMLSLPALVGAATIKNDVNGVGPHQSVKPYLCIQNSSETVTLPLAPGASGDGNAASGNAYYVGGSFRFGGCTPNDSYLGYAGFALSNSGNNSLSSYEPPNGVHIKINNLAIDSKGTVTGIVNYTPIMPNFTMAPAHDGVNWPMAGVNLSGLEFSKTTDPVVVPNLSVEDKNSPYNDLAETEAFIAQGINAIRVPVSWDYLQLEGPGVGGINADYYDSYVRPLLQSLTHAKVHTIVDLHAYMRYSEFGKQYSGCFPGAAACPDGTLILDPAAYQSIWGQLADKILNDSLIDKDYIAFDLMNEPVTVPDDKVLTIQASIINLLRSKNFAGYIFVEGNAWSGLHSWTTAHWTGSDGQDYTNATLFTPENFAKAGVTDLSKVVINVHQYLDSDFSGNSNDCLQDLSTTGDNGFNLDAFTQYLKNNHLNAIVTEFGVGKNEASCKKPLQQFLQYLKDNGVKTNDNGFIGWTMWSTGHGWGDYNLRVTSTSYQALVMDSFLK